MHNAFTSDLLWKGKSKTIVNEKLTIFIDWQKSVMYHYSRMEPLFYHDEKHRKFFLLLHVLFLVDTYGANAIIAVLPDVFFFNFLLTLWFILTFLS